MQHIYSVKPAKDVAHKLSVAGIAEKNAGLSRGKAILFEDNILSPFIPTIEDEEKSIGGNTKT